MRTLNFFFLLYRKNIPKPKRKKISIYYDERGSLFCKEKWYECLWLNEKNTCFHITTKGQVLNWFLLDLNWRCCAKSRQLFHVLLLNTKEFKLRKHVGELLWALRPNTRVEIFKRNKARMIPVFLTVNLKLIWRRIQSGQKGHVFQRDVMENTNCLANIIGRRRAAAVLCVMAHIVAGADGLLYSYSSS
jgi:hypothetical protein